MRLKQILFITLVFALTISSCGKKRTKYLNQGEIHYNIDYKGKIGLPKEFLPSDLIVSFKDDKILFEMNGLGNSGILNLSNPEKGIFDTYFSLIAVKYYYAASPGELYPGFESMDGMKLSKTSKTSVICGFNCKNAEITFPSDRKKIYDVWYTNEINIENPNSATPFHEIDGVLMSFFFLMGPSELHFKAENVYKKDVPDRIFERREKYMKVSREQIVRFITTLVSL